MYRSRQKHSARIRGFAIATILIAAIGATIGSCVFDTKTNFCEQFGLRCKEGQECAANQPVCINVGGCGNHHLDPGEACDDGNTMDGDGCSADCLSDETCGNGITDRNAAIPEECDDGKLNGVGNDICDSNCHLRSFVCGNKIVDQDQGEQCDPGPTDSETCNSDLANMNGLMAGCKLSRCGDGYTNMAAKEQCDTNGTDTLDCNGLLCKFSVCGDNYHNAAAGEACDNGSTDTVGCNGNNNGSNNPANCQFPSCGDGYIKPSSSPAEHCFLNNATTSGVAIQTSVTATTRVPTVRGAAGSPCAVTATQTWRQANIATTSGVAIRIRATATTKAPTVRGAASFLRAAMATQTRKPASSATSSGAATRLETAPHQGATAKLQAQQAATSPSVAMAIPTCRMEKLVTAAAMIQRHVTAARRCLPMWHVSLPYAVTRTSTQWRERLATRAAPIQKLVMATMRDLQVASSPMRVPEILT